MSGGPVFGGHVHTQRRGDPEVVDEHDVGPNLEPVEPRLDLGALGGQLGGRQIEPVAEVPGLLRQRVLVSGRP